MNRQGFTLVELLIATGILSVLLLAFTSYLFYQSRMSKFQTDRESYQSLQTSVLNSAGQEESLIQSERLEK
jgi:prepilin-type N-terminal cleavage/methylation domain-containing protein